MKRIISLILAALLLIAPLGALAEDDDRVDCYERAKKVIARELGDPDYVDEPAEELDGLLSVIILEEEDDSQVSVMVVGPKNDETMYTIWYLDMSSPEVPELFIWLLDEWDTMTDWDDTLDFGVHYMTHRVGSGLIEAPNREVAALLLDMYAIYGAAGGNTEAVVEVPSVPEAPSVPEIPDIPEVPAKPQLPSMLSFSGYRLAEYDVIDDYGRLIKRYDGIASRQLAVDLVEDYVDMLVDEYGYELVNAERPGIEGNIIDYYYYLDYTDDPSLRPIAVANFSSHVNVNIFILYDTVKVSVMWSDGIDYVETTDTTDVNFQNR